MNRRLKERQKEWLRRYIPAEILGTATALIAAWLAFDRTHSFIAATASGWVGEGIGFYGYFITLELVANSKRYSGRPWIKQVSLAITAASTNLLV